ncbi:MAG: chromosome condensation regulator [Hyperionvirus sp.]|uniref:Chromosome condensation regulator n=1 Tax=Hyperionvirus sp. TaxID=2487770 RepID=A0A3G5A5A5_9VIRU|nr:MAG: chromosome condensation regulator [Hyperionvirus sp.]
MSDIYFMLLRMDLISLIENLPIDLLYIVTNYDPAVICNSGGKYDWFKLIRMNFSLMYDRELCTNEEVRRVYLDYCDKSRKSIFAGVNHAIIRLGDGTLMGCGYNEDGRLGLGGSRNQFLKLDGVPGDIIEVICEGSVIILRLGDGTLMGCGFNEYGQLGLGDCRRVKQFLKIDGIPKNIVEVICSEATIIIRLTDGTLMGCGNNSLGQLGLGDRGSRNEFIKISGIPKNIVRVMCYASCTVIKLTDGTLMGCGYNSHGQLGLGDCQEKRVFREIVGIPKNVAQVILGISHIFIFLTDGTLLSCGDNRFGQLGLGDNSARYSFQEIRGIGKNIAEVICKTLLTIIRLTDGTLMGCGYNYFGELGLGDNMHRNIFTEIRGIPKNVSKVVCSQYWTDIILTDGTLMSCGLNDYGQLGFGDSRSKYSFTEITGVPKNIIDVISGPDYRIVRLKDGTLMSCGGNRNGQLGLGDSVDRILFEEIKGIPKLKS